MKPLETRVLALIDSYKDDMTEFCRQLVKTPSVCGIDNEKAVAELIFSKAESIGLRPAYASKVADRPNVLMSYGHGVHPCLLFLGHMDTVPAGDESRWKCHPFSGEIEEGKLYGRGSIDTKGGIASALFALKALVESEAILPGRVSLAAVCDEESGARSDIGLKHLIEKGVIQADSAIYVYPGTDHVFSGHRGYIRFKAVATGEAVHTGALRWEQGKKGCNAVTGMAEFLLALEHLEIEASVRGAFEGRRTVITPGTVIEGGTSISIVPDTCEAWCDVRTLPGQAYQDLLSRVRAIADSVCSGRLGLDIRLEEVAIVPAVEISPEESVIKLLVGNAERILGKTPRVKGAGPANEGYMLINKGIATVCGFGPDGNNAHSVDEYVDLDSLVQVAKVYALTTLHFCNKDIP